MAKYKAALLILMRKLFQTSGPGVEQAFLRRLTPEEIRLYQTALPITWVPIDQAERMLQAAAAALYPQDPMGLRRLGAEEAKDNLRGIYKALLQVVSVTTAMEQVARIWRTYHDEGDARADRAPNGKTGRMVVENYPRLPEVNREVLAGFITATLEMSGQKNVRVQRDDTDPNAWKWDISYD
jgi:hypothetical protein